MKPDRIITAIVTWLIAANAIYTRDALDLSNCFDVFRLAGLAMMIVTGTLILVLPRKHIAIMCAGIIATALWFAPIALKILFFEQFSER